MTRAAAPNRRAVEAGNLLASIIAPRITASLEHIARELSACDGYSSGSENTKVNASSELTPTEAAAQARYELTKAREELRDLLGAVCSIIDELNRMSGNVLRMRNPAPIPSPVKLCKDSQHGKEGAIEWGDPLCMMPATKGGMCGAHYFAWYRHRRAHGIDVTGDHQPA